MHHTLQSQINQQKKILYNKYVKGENANYNKQRIDWVLQNVYKKQIKTLNRNEEKVLNRLFNHRIYAESQKIIPILQSGGKINHLYVADIVVDKTIIEVDGPQHEKQKEWDAVRDIYTKQEGYSVIRIPTTDLSNETIDEYLKELY